MQQYYADRVNNNGQNDDDDDNDVRGKNNWKKIYWNLKSNWNQGKK